MGKITLCGYHYGLASEGKLHVLNNIPVGKVGKCGHLKVVKANMKRIRLNLKTFCTGWISLLCLLAMLNLYKMLSLPLVMKENCVWQR